MQLPPWLFQDIAGCEPPRGDGWGKERRQACRIPITLRVNFSITREPVVAVIREVSISGMSVMLSRPLHVETAINVFIARRGRPTITLGCDVVRCQASRQNIYIAGVAFVSFKYGKDHPVETPLGVTDAEMKRIRTALLS